MCPSEVSDIEQTLWQKYKEQGLVVWAIGPQDGLSNLQTFQEQMGVTYPILYDDGGLAHAEYNPGQKTTNSVYPQDWIIGPDGNVLYVNTAYEPNEMIAVIEAALEK